MEKKVALITGAGSGIGKAIAIKLAKEGYRVAVCGRSLNNVDETVKKIIDNSGDAKAYIIDTASEEEWIKTVKDIIHDFGNISVLVNSAGIYATGPVVELDLKDWNHLLSVNVTGYFLGMKHTLPHLEKSHGVIVNIASDASLNGYENHIAYGASKGAIFKMTRDVAAEYITRNVRVNSILPAEVKTKMVAGLPDEEIAGRNGQVILPEDVAELAFFLVSDKSKHITGTEIIIDNGLTNLEFPETMQLNRQSS